MLFLSPLAPLLLCLSAAVHGQIGLPIDAPCGAEISGASLCIATDVACAARCGAAGVMPQQQDDADGDVTQCNIALQSLCNIMACCPNCSDDIQLAIDCQLTESCGAENTSCDDVELQPPGGSFDGDGGVPDSVSEACISKYYEFTGCFAANLLQCTGTCTDEALVGETDFDNIDCNDETEMMELCGNVVCCAECATQARSYYNCQADERSCSYDCNLDDGGETGGDPDGSTGSGVGEITEGQGTSGASQLVLLTSLAVATMISSFI